MYCATQSSKRQVKNFDVNDEMPEQVRHDRIKEILLSKPEDDIFFVPEDNNGMVSHEIAALRSQ